MHYVDLIVEKRDHVATITFNRPERLNAFRRHTYHEMLETLADIDADEDVHSVILAANGRGFCTGHDMGEAPQPPELRLSRHAGGRKYSDICEALLQLRQPLVAAINGWCAAGGFGFALCCDILIAGEDARFYNPQIKFGYPSLPGVGALLNLYTSPAVTKDIILGRRNVDAQDALRMGIVSRVVPNDRLLEEAWSVAAKMAETPPDIMAMQREMMNRIWIAQSGAYLSLVTGRDTAIAGHSLPDWEETEADWKNQTRDVDIKH